MARTKKIYCPVNGWDCPYFKDGECGIENPIEECDDFGFFWDADEDYLADEERTLFEKQGLTNNPTSIIINVQ